VPLAEVPALSEPKNADRLRQIMAKHGLTQKQVGEFVHVPWTTVTAWLRPTGNKAFREMPIALLELLEFKTNRLI
jgi:transcriptional regulator with XRE-family HTH domain